MSGFKKKKKNRKIVMPINSSKYVPIGNDYGFRENSKYLDYLFLRYAKRNEIDFL